MKTAIILLALFTQIAFGQKVVKEVKDLKTKYVSSYKTVSVTHLKMFDGSVELTGQFIDQQGEKTFWVKNAELKSGNRILLDMGLSLKADNILITQQLPAVYGYIVEITGDNLLSLWIVDENGIRNSDEIIVQLKNKDAYVYSSGE